MSLCQQLLQFLSDVNRLCRNQIIKYIMIHCHHLHPHLAWHHILFFHYMMLRNHIQIKRSKLNETYDSLPQDYKLTNHDLCAHIAIQSSLRKQLLLKIDGSSVLQNQLMCLLDEKEWINDDVSTLPK
ncbi:hypothetical protein ACQJBY_068507 [Aegilops geniculata]